MKKLWLAFSVIWTIFTFSMVAWWWFYVYTGPEMDLVRRNRMLLWEGSILLIAVLVGGLTQIWFIKKEQDLNNKLKLFFSNFSHDIKTAITRLRLQADILREDEQFKENKTLGRLLKDINSLDLQLENSLNLTNVDRFEFLLEPVLLKSCTTSLLEEFPDLNIQVPGDIKVIADKRVLMSVFRNIFENARLHGKAKTVTIKKMDTQQEQFHFLKIENDGDPIDNRFLPKNEQLLKNQNTKTNGIGLYISKKLVEKMQGQMTFEVSDHKKLIQRLVLRKA